MNQPGVKDELLSRLQQQQLADRACVRVCQTIGRGPSHCKVTVAGDEVTIKGSGFLIQLEEALIKAGDRDLVVELRRRLLRATMPAWQEDFASVGLRIVSASSLVDCDHNVRTLVFKVERA